MSEITRGVGRAELLKLKAFFPEDDLEWKTQMCRKARNGSYWVLVVPYMNRRAVMDRLDFVCGPENWKDNYASGPNGGVMCMLSIRVNGEWITKCDAAENTNIEAIKGGISDAFKRAATKWGIGRYLAQFPRMYAIIDENGNEYTYYKPKQGNRELVKYRNPPVPIEWLPSAEESEVVKGLRVEIEAVLDEIPRGKLSVEKSSWLEKKLQFGFTEGEARRTLAGLKEQLNQIKNPPPQGKKEGAKPPAGNEEGKKVSGGNPPENKGAGASAESQYI